MTERISFTFEGEPVAKGRARFVSVGDHKIAFTPAKTRKYEAALGYAVRQAMKERPLLQGPLDLFILAAFPIPASWSKKKRERALAGEILPVVRPDVDNLIKTICDACNCIVFLDDKQVVDVTMSKRYSARPGIHVEVVQLEGEEKRRPEAGKRSGRQFCEGGRSHR